MDVNEIKRIAKERRDFIRKIEEKPFFKRVLDTFVSLGLLIDKNKNDARKIHLLKMKEIVTAAQAEPRLMEVLPAFAFHYRILIRDKTLPKDLTLVIQKYKQGIYLPFRNINNKHIEWIDFHKPKGSTKQKISVANLPQISRDLRSVRRSAGFSRSVFAEIFGVSQNSIEKIESGKLNVRHEAALQVQEILDRAASF